MMPDEMYKKFVCLWHFVGWELISIGISIDLNSPNIEIHLPFGFIRIGMEKRYRKFKPTFMESYLFSLEERITALEKK